MFCSKCGKEIADESVFCPYCGNNFASNKKPQIKKIIAAACLIVLIGAGLFGYQIWHKSTLSPIEDVSKKIYVTDMETIDEYLAPDMRSDIKDLYKQGTSTDDVRGVVIDKLEGLITEDSTENEKLLIQKTKEIIGLYDASISSEIWMEEQYNNSQYVIEQIAIQSAMEENKKKTDAVINTAYEALKNAKNKADLEAINTKIM